MAGAQPQQASARHARTGCDTSTGSVLNPLRFVALYPLNIGGCTAHLFPDGPPEEGCCSKGAALQLRGLVLRPQDPTCAHRDLQFAGWHRHAGQWPRRHFTRQRPAGWPGRGPPCSAAAAAALWPPAAVPAAAAISTAARHWRAATVRGGGGSGGGTWAAGCWCAGRHANHAAGPAARPGEAGPLCEPAVGGDHAAMVIAVFDSKRCCAPWECAVCLCAAAMLYACA
jgi:hypothetical protein